MLQLKIIKIFYNETIIYVIYVKITDHYRIFVTKYQFLIDFCSKSIKSN